MKSNEIGEGLAKNNICEGLAKIEVEDGVFFNKNMDICRSLCSLWMGTLPEIKLGIDGFCASGARGIRYLLENENVQKIVFVDRSQRAIECTMHNLKLNNVEFAGLREGRYDVGGTKHNLKLNNVEFADERKDNSGAGKKDLEAENLRAAAADYDIRQYFLQNPQFDFAEIDPFGTPAPYLDALFGADSSVREKYISITATDMAVLCGAHHAACVKNYSSVPLDNEFCHENALRILLGKIARTGAQYDWALEPQFCFSHRHYVKILAKIKRGAKGALESAKAAAGYVEYCPKCLYHKMIERGFPESNCPICGKKLSYAGQMWSQKWCERKIVEKMARLLAKREYLDAREPAKMLQIIEEESTGPAFYYDLHVLGKKKKIRLAKNEDVVCDLKERGFFASRTHFSNTSIRTNAPVLEIEKSIANCRKD